MNAPKGSESTAKNTFLEAVPRLCGKKVLIVGDVMLDEYLIGDTERISPEAPVPIVLIAEDKHVLGGAGNVARNITALGGHPCLVGLHGNDLAGKSLEACLKRESVPAELLLSKNRSTTIKTRILARQQQVLRIDREHNAPLTAAEVSKILSAVENHLENSQVIVISDYGKGVVCREIMNGIFSLLEKRGLSVPILVDPKPQNIGLYEGVTLLTPNARETSEGAGLPVDTQEEIVAAGQAIMKRLKSQYLVTTLGAQGMAVFTGKEVWHIPTSARSVFDVTGAGDTVIATTALGLAAGEPILTACMLANYAAGLVVAEVGAATASREKLLDAITRLPLPQIERWG